MTNGILNVGERGETEFGWDTRVYDNIHDRINFAYLQTGCGENAEYLAMLDKVLRDNVQGLIDIQWNISSAWSSDLLAPKVHGYIDHQSSWVEGQNLEMFENEQTLKDFIFGMCSYIQGGNDNDY